VLQWSAEDEEFSSDVRFKVIGVMNALTVRAATVAWIPLALPAEIRGECRGPCLGVSCERGCAHTWCRLFEHHQDDALTDRGARFRLVPAAGVVAYQFHDRVRDRYVKPALRDLRIWRSIHASIPSRLSLLIGIRRRRSW
jgi:hypothetical protein